MYSVAAWAAFSSDAAKLLDVTALMARFTGHSQQPGPSVLNHRSPMERFVQPYEGIVGNVLSHMRRQSESLNVAEHIQAQLFLQRSDPLIERQWKSDPLPASEPIPLYSPGPRGPPLLRHF